MRELSEDTIKDNIFYLGEFELDNIYCGNPVELIKKIPDNSIDLIVTDPPFAIDFGPKRSNYNRKDSNVLEGYSEVSKKEYYNFSFNWIK